jgi:hypothetical protein
MSVIPGIERCFSFLTINLAVIKLVERLDEPEKIILKHNFKKNNRKGMSLWKQEERKSEQF